VEPGKKTAVEFTLPPVIREVPKAPPKPAVTLQTSEYFENPAGWTKEDGGWWTHKGGGESWLKNNQGVYVVEFLRQSAKIAFIKRTQKVEWVVDQRQDGQIDYSFDFKNGALDVRVTADGKTKSHKVQLGSGAISSDSYTIQIDISPERILIKGAQGNPLDLYNRPNPAEALGKFGFRGQVALKVNSRSDH
jgi:hypothetical protein